MKYHAGQITSWGLDCWEKYQQPHICKWYHPKGRKRRGTKEPLDESERTEQKHWLKTLHSKLCDHGILSHGFSWKMDGGKVEAVTSFIFSGSKITVDCDCSVCWRRAMTKLHSLLKSRDITLPTKICIIKIMVFPIVIYRYESWIINNTECGRIDAFEFWCWRRLLRVPWTGRSSNLSVLQEIKTEFS